MTTGRIITCGKVVCNGTPYAVNGTGGTVEKVLCKCLEEDLDHLAELAHGGGRWAISIPNTMYWYGFSCAPFSALFSYTRVKNEETGVALSLPRGVFCFRSSSNGTCEHVSKC